MEIRRLPKDQNWQEQWNHKEKVKLASRNLEKAAIMDTQKRLQHTSPEPSQDLEDVIKVSRITPDQLLGTSKF